MKTKVSKAQIEVWDWKEKVYQKIKDLPKGEVLKFIIAETKDLENKIKKSKQKQSYPLN